METELAIEPQVLIVPTQIHTPGRAGGCQRCPSGAVIGVAAAYLPWVWIVGAPLTFLLLATGVVGAERLRRESRLIVDGPIAECAARVAESLRIGRRVTLAVCSAWLRRCWWESCGR